MDYLAGRGTILIWIAMFYVQCFFSFLSTQSIINMTKKLISVVIEYKLQFFCKYPANQTLDARHVCSMSKMEWVSLSLSDDLSAYALWMKKYIAAVVASAILKKLKKWLKKIVNFYKKLPKKIRNPHFTISGSSSKTLISPSEFSINILDRKVFKTSVNHSI